MAEENVTITPVVLGSVVCKFTLPMQIIDEINSSYDEGRNQLKPFNTELAGKIKEEHLSNDLLSQSTKIAFVNCFAEYIRHIQKPFWGLSLGNAWINEMKAGEYNPLHYHSGVYSFVIWMKIPFKWEEQNKKDIARKSNSPSIALFQYAYQNILGELAFHRYESSPEDEGIMLFFPSQLNHLVYPFYDCDEDRISVSGNIGLNTTKVV